MASTQSPTLTHLPACLPAYLPWLNSELFSPLTGRFRGEFCANSDTCVKIKGTAE